MRLGSLGLGFLEQKYALGGSREDHVGLCVMFRGLRNSARKHCLCIRNFEGHVQKKDI